MNQSQRFETFTERARKVLTLAQEEAERLNQGYIGTKHLLAGLIREGEGLAARVLFGYQITLKKVRLEILPDEAYLRNQSGTPGLTEPAKRIVEQAVQEAKALGHPYLGTEHLLLALCGGEENEAQGILKRLGVDPGEVRQTILKMVSQPFVPGLRVVKLVNKVKHLFRR